MDIPPEVRNVFGDSLPVRDGASIGRWESRDDDLQVNAIGGVALRTLILDEPVEDTVFSVEFADLDNIFQVGVIVHSTEDLDSGLGVFYYPRTGNIRAVDMKAPRGKVTAEYENMFGQWAPVADHDLTDRPKTMRFEVVIRGDVIEAFVGGVCCMTYRAKASAQPVSAIVAIDGTATITEQSWQQFGK